jgi:hypothetical protein
MRWITSCAGLALAIGFGSVLAQAAGWVDKPASAKPAGIDAIQAYEGSWDVSIDCWKSGGYFACNQYVNGESKALLVFTYDESRNVYTSYPIPRDGGAAGSGKLLIEGNVWTFPWEVKEGDKTTYFRVVNVFVTQGQIEFRQEFSSDNVHWTVMARGVEKKVSGK